MANSPTKALTNAPVFPVGGIVDPPDRRLRRPAARPPTTPASRARSRSSSAARARSSRSGQLAQAAGATGVIIYNEGNDASAPEPDLRRQPAGSAGDDRGGDHQLHARQRAAAGLQAGQEPDRRLQGLRRLDGSLPQPGDRGDPGGDPNHVVVVGAHLDSVPGRPGHQRRRLRHRDAARPGPGARRRPLQPAPEDPLRLVGRRGERARGLDLLRPQPQPEGGGQDRRDARLRHARVAQLRPLRL